MTVRDVPNVDAREVRASLQMTQDQFSKRFGLGLSTLRQWEQGRRQPDRAARVLLLVIARSPSTVDDALVPPSFPDALSHPT